MNGNSLFNGNGHQKYNNTTIDDDRSLNGKSSFDNTTSTEHFQNKFPLKSASQYTKMATNGNTSSTEEQREDSFLDVTRRYKLLLKIFHQRGLIWALT